MPYGLARAIQTCQQGLDTVQRDCKHCVDNYIDNSVVFSSDMTPMPKGTGSFTECWIHPRGSKCVFGKTNITHLGFQYDLKEVSSLADRIQTVLNLSVPKSTKELHSFLGLTNFYRRFVRNHADTAAPPTDLTSSKETFTWSP